MGFFSFSCLSSIEHLEYTSLSLPVLFTSPTELCSEVHRRQWHISQHMVFHMQDFTRVHILDVLKVL